MASGGVRNVKKLEAAYRKRLERSAKLASELETQTRRAGETPSKKKQSQITSTKKKIERKDKELAKLAGRVQAAGGVLDVLRSPGNNTRTASGLATTQSSGGRGTASRGTPGGRRDVRAQASVSESGNVEQRQDDSGTIPVYSNFYDILSFYPIRGLAISFHKSVIIKITGGAGTHVEKRFRERVVTKLMNKAVDRKLTATSQWRSTFGQEKQMFSFPAFLDSYLSYISIIVCLYVKLKAALHMRRQYSVGDNSSYGVAAWFRNQYLGVEPHHIQDRLDQLGKQLRGAYLPDGLVKLLVELCVPFFDSEHGLVLQDGMLYEIIPVFETVGIATGGRSFNMKPNDVSLTYLGDLAVHGNMLKRGRNSGDFLLKTTDVLLNAFFEAQFSWLSEGLNTMSVNILNFDLLENVGAYPMCTNASASLVLKNSSNTLDVRLGSALYTRDPRVNEARGTGLVWHDKTHISYKEDGSLYIKPTLGVLTNHKRRTSTLSGCNNRFQPGFIRCMKPEFNAEYSIYKMWENGRYRFGVSMAMLDGNQRGIPHVKRRYIDEWVKRNSSELEGNKATSSESVCVVNDMFYDEWVIKSIEALWDWEVCKDASVLGLRKRLNCRYS
jgi:hypothetical protein